MNTKLQSDGTSCPAALLRLGVPAQRLTRKIMKAIVYTKYGPPDVICHSLYGCE